MNIIIEKIEKDLAIKINFFLPYLSDKDPKGIINNAPTNVGTESKIPII